MIAAYGDVTAVDHFATYAIILNRGDAPAHATCCRHTIAMRGSFMVAPAACLKPGAPLKAIECTILLRRCKTQRSLRLLLHQR